MFSPMIILVVLVFGREAAVTESTLINKGGLKIPLTTPNYSEEMPNM